MVRFLTMKWFLTVAFFMVPSIAFGQAPLPVPDDGGGSDSTSIECDFLTQLLSDCSDSLAAVNKSIARNRELIAFWDADLAFWVREHERFLAMGDYVPPGIPERINILRGFIRQLEREIREKQAELKTLTQQWSTLWYQWEIAGCK